MFLQKEVAELRAGLEKANAEKEDWGLCTRWLICLASLGYVMTMLHSSMSEMAAAG